MKGVFLSKENSFDFYLGIEFWILLLGRVGGVFSLHRFIAIPLKSSCSFASFSTSEYFLMLSLLSKLPQSSTAP